MSQFQLTTPILHTSNYSSKYYKPKYQLYKQFTLHLIFNGTVN